jgi:hypothetical protein
MMCGAKAGNGGKLVTIVNYSAEVRTFSYDPSPYVGTGAAQSWKIIGSNNTGCGQESTMPSVFDCGIGSTQVVGATTVTFGPGSETLPAPGAAPIAQTTLTMQPMEADVFLYHQ